MASILESPIVRNSSRQASPSEDASAAGVGGYSRRQFLSSLGLLGAAAAGTQLVRALPARADQVASAPSPSATAALGTGVLTTTGLYAGAWDYLNNRAAARTLGCTAIRTTNSGMTDAGWQAMRDDGLDVHVTISGTDRSKFTSDNAWIADYLNQVDTYLTRWPTRWVEIWNEPNWGLWSGATAAQKQVAYGKLLVASYQHIKSRWPGVGVVGFGAGAASAAAPGFIKGVLAAVPQAAQSFDVCSLHPYFGNTAPEQVRTEAWGSWTIAGQVASIRKMGVSTPIWFTEAGWNISKADGGTFDGNTGTVSPTLQAAYRVRMFVLCLNLNVARLNHMYVIDQDRYNGGFFVNKQPRLQAVALTVQQAILPNPTAITALSEGPDAYVYRVTTSNGPVTVAWSDTGAQPSVACTPGSQVIDMLGNVVATTSGSSQVLRLSSTPTYVLPGHAAVAAAAKIGTGSSSKSASARAASKAKTPTPKHRPRPTKKAPRPKPLPSKKKHHG